MAVYQHVQKQSKLTFVYLQFNDILVDIHKAEVQR